VLIADIQTDGWWASALTGADPLSLNKADPADARLPVGGCGGGICGTGSR
jgi:hypothetical protein